MSNKVRKVPIGRTKYWVLGVSLVVVALLVVVSLAVTAETIPTISPDKSDYMPGETVVLTGAGWQAGEAVDIFVNDVDFNSWSHNSDPDPVADGGGGFTYGFQLPDWFVSNYVVKATGLNSGAVATATFTDANITIQQCRNGADGLGPSCDWTGGNAGASNSLYLEGDSIPYRVVLQGLTGGQTYWVRIGWDTIKYDSGAPHNALDQITSYDQTVTFADPCGGMTGSLSGVACTKGIDESTHAIPPDDNLVPANGYHGTPVAGEFTMWHAAIVSAGNNAPAFDNDQYTRLGDFPNNTSSSEIVVKFTVNAGETDAVLAWGGHFAARVDWAPALTASDITGSPYHTFLDGWTGGSTGSQDCSLSAAAVIAPGSITICKQATPYGSTPFPFTGDQGLGSFNIVDNQDPVTCYPTFSGLIDFVTYHVTEAAPAGWTLDSCSCDGGGSDTSCTAGAGASIGLDEGEDVTCTFYDSRDQGSIELKKAWSGTGGQTTLKIGTTAGGDEVDSQLTGANGAAPLTTGANTVDTGTYYVSESGGLTDYDSSLACTKNGNAYTPGANNSVAVGKNDVVVCTFTNTRQTGSIELKKVWDGTGGQTTLKIGTTAGGDEVDSQLTGANGAAPLTTGANTVDTGTYYVSESGGLTDYDSSLTCTKNGNAYTPGANNSVAVGKNDVVVCTFTNTRQTGSIELKKVWVGGGGQTTLEIGSTAGGDEVDSQLTGADGAAPLTTGPNTVDTGTYYVSESGGLTDYDSSLACTKNGNAYTPGANDSVVVGKNDVVVCTFTNTKHGKITIIKVTVPSPDPQDFNFVAPQLVPDTFTLDTDPGSPPPYMVSYNGLNVFEDKTVAEVLVAGWDLSDIQCTGDPDVMYGTLPSTWHASFVAGDTAVKIDLDPGEEVACTFTNTLRTPGCGYTWGYWKNHNKYQNAGGAHRDAGWDMVLPDHEDTQFFGNWENPPTDDDPLTWYEILLIPPKGGDAYFILAHQYVAAWLNIHKPVDPANEGLLPANTMSDAEALLSHYNTGLTGYPPEIPKGATDLGYSPDDRAKAIELAGILDQFNSGTLPGGPPHCGD